MISNSKNELIELLNSIEYFKFEKVDKKGFDCNYTSKTVTIYIASMYDNICVISFYNTSEICKYKTLALEGSSLEYPSSIKLDRAIGLLPEEIRKQFLFNLDLFL